MTSIEWLIDQLEQKGDMRETASIRNLQLNIDTSDYLELKRQAKEMHKQEIIDAWNGGDYAHFYSKETGRDFADGSEYYQETFVSKGSDEVEVPKHPSVISENGNELLFDKEGNLIKELPQETFVSKGSDECQFEPTTNTSSATICKHCGREKFLHTI